MENMQKTTYELVLKRDDQTDRDDPSILEPDHHDANGAVAAAHPDEGGAAAAAPR